MIWQSVWFGGLDVPRMGMRAGILKSLHVILEGWTRVADVYFML